MIVPLRAVWCVTAVVGTTLVAGSAWAWARSSIAERTQIQRLTRLTAHSQTLANIRTRLPPWALNPPTSGTLAPQVSAALAASGLPPATMASLSADTEATGGGVQGVQVKRRRATLVLGSLTLPQLGTFLQTWRERQPAWTVSLIEVHPEQSSPAAGSALARTGGDLPLRVTLTLESLSLERASAR